MKYIGKMIGSLRCEKEISQKDLARGVISTAELSRIENGTKEANSLILEVLLQRLGKSLDRLEYIASNEEYQEICLKEMICQELACEDYEMAEMLLTEYEAYGAENNVLCRQFVMQIRAVIEFVKKKDIGQCFQKLREALELTCMEWEEEKLEEMYLCTQEIQILLTLYYLRLLEQTVKGEEIVRLAEYIDSHYTEEKEKVKVFPQAVYLAGRVAFAEGNFGKAYKLYQAGKQCLMENGVLDLMSKILEGEKECLEKTERWEEAAEREKTLAAIDFLYEQAQKEKTEEEMLFFVLKSHQKDVVILDLSIPVNRQYIGHKELQRKIEEEKLRWEEICDELIRLLRYTMKDFSGQVYRELSIEEFAIINHMALC